MRRLASITAAVLLAAAPARADQPDEPHKERPPATPPPPELPPGPTEGRAAVTDIRGLEDEGSEEGDGWREAGNVALWVPRNVVDILFRGTSTAAGLIADEQLVPRYRDILGTKGGDIFVFPTLFAETGSGFSVGLRMIADTRYVSTTQRVGYGGPEDVVVESRIRFKGGRSVPFAIALEGFYELSSEREYHGIGITPTIDDRNQFNPNNPERVGLYLERRTRGIASIGTRLSDELEFFLSGSLQRRHVEDTPESGAEALSQVFLPGSVTGPFLPSWIVYAETAARFDTRIYRGRPTKGFLLEGYLGGADDTEGDAVAFMRLGFRGAAYFPIYRSTNLLSPRIVLDRLVPLNHLPVPFTELPRQPDFRGFDTRRDFISIVTSLDYTWQLVPFMGMRLFLDGATVAPGLKELSFDHIKELRYAGGLGIDLFTNTSELGRIAISTGPEGVRLLASFGVPSDYGDRQHRE